MPRRQARPRRRYRAPPARARQSAGRSAPYAADVIEGSHSSRRYLRTQRASSTRGWRADRPCTRRRGDSPRNDGDAPTLPGSDQEVLAMSATRLTGLYAVLAAAAAVSSLHCSPCRTRDCRGSPGARDRDGFRLGGAGARPRRRAADLGLPDRVYSTYVQVFALLFPAVFLSARAVSARRSVRGGRLERWGGRIALVGYGLRPGPRRRVLRAAGSRPEANAASRLHGADGPRHALSIVGSTVLGIALLPPATRPNSRPGFLRSRFHSCSSPVARSGTTASGSSRCSSHGPFPGGNCGVAKPRLAGDQRRADRASSPPRPGTRATSRSATTR